MKAAIRIIISYAQSYQSGLLESIVAVGPEVHDEERQREDRIEGTRLIGLSDGQVAEESQHTTQQSHHRSIRENASTRCSC